MRGVILAAGVGRRMNINYNKTLTELRPGFRVLDTIIDNMLSSDIYDINLAVGYDGDTVRDKIEDSWGEHPVATFTYFYSHNYTSSNNLYTLHCMRDELIGREFVLINGDLVFEPEILERVIDMPAPRIAVTRDTSLDYPGVTINGDQDITDLGRHIHKPDALSIGIYYFSSAISHRFFNHVDTLTVKELRMYGFHEPLRSLFHDGKIKVTDVTDLQFTDIDTKEDIERAKEIE